MKKNYIEILCAGFGGQGIMFMGKLLAGAGLLAGRHVTWMPSYGAEVRGGTAYSMTKISDEEIASPLIMNPDVLIVMNKPSLVKYEGKLKDGGVLVSNRSLVGEVAKRKGITLINIPMTEWASKLGDVRIANIIAIGAMLRKANAVSSRSVLAALNEALKGKEDLFLLNKRALEKGYKGR